MKSFMTLFFCILLISATNAQTVPEVQLSMINKVTATWCSNCGSWGWDLYEGLAEDNASKAIMMKAHYSGDLNTAIGGELADNFGATSQPRFIVNNVDQNASSSSASTKRTEIKQTIDATFLEAPVVNAGVTATLEGNELNITVKTKFFQADSGEFYTNVYIVEDNVIANQSGNSAGANTSHQDILRTAANSSTFGEQIVNGDVSGDMEFSQNYTVALNPVWDLDNLEFVAIVWFKSGETYTFENGSSALLSTTSPVKDIAEDIKLNIQPTLVMTHANISISLEENKDLSIELINLQGQVLKNIHIGELSVGQHDFSIKKGNLASGVYLVSIQGNEGLATRRIVIQ